MTHQCPPAHRHDESATCYNQHKCRCTPCSRRNAAYHKRIRLTMGKDVEVSAQGARRRLQALTALGYSKSRMADFTGMQREQLGAVRSGKHRTVRMSTHRKVAVMYRRVLNERPPVGRKPWLAKRQATLEGWHGPLAWENIDTDKEPQ